VVTDYMWYKMLYMIRPLQRRPLVSDTISLKKLYLPVLRTVKNCSYIRIRILTNTQN